MKPLRVNILQPHRLPYPHKKQIKITQKLSTYYFIASKITVEEKNE